MAKWQTRKKSTVFAPYPTPSADEIKYIRLRKKGGIDMTTFNTKSNRFKTTNMEGHAAYAYTDKIELLTRVAACMVNEPKFYGDTTDTVFQLASRIAEREPDFVSKLAVYARNVLMMRSVSHMLVCVVAASDAAQGTGLVRSAARGVVRRGDDVTNVLAAWRALFPRKQFPNGMVKGLRDAMERFSAYDVAKYREIGKTISMRDALRIVHPRPKDIETAAAFDACVAGTLPRPISWETELSAYGNTADVWNGLLRARKVPPMALVRNLRNIIQSGADLNPVYEALADENAIRRSGILPFRLYSAYREIAGMSGTKLVRSVDAALSSMCCNYPELRGRTAIFIDSSGSMRGARISSKSTVCASEVAALMASAITMLSDDAYIYLFDQESRRVSADPGTSILGFTEKVIRESRGGWTDMNAAFENLQADGIDVDRIIVLSDNQSNVGSMTAQSCLDRYRASVGHDVWMHGWDFAGYGTTQFFGGKVNYLCGFSDRAIEFIHTAEQGFGAMVDAVEEIDLR